MPEPEPAGFLYRVRVSYPSQDTEDTIINSVHAGQASTDYSDVMAKREDIGADWVVVVESRALMPWTEVDPAELPRGRRRSAIHPDSGGIPADEPAQPGRDA
jgi:hypothetical protein